MPLPAVVGIITVVTLVTVICALVAYFDNQEFGPNPVLAKMETNNKPVKKSRSKKKKRKSGTFEGLEERSLEWTEMFPQTHSRAPQTSSKDAAALRADLHEGIELKHTPTPEELQRALALHQPEAKKLHFAVVGIAGSGKSSFVNAICGRSNNSPGAAAVGTTETTIIPDRYPDPKHPWVWHDIPGAGTLSVPHANFFHDQGLFIFDAIIILFDSRFTLTDITILKQSARYMIPTYIVRSKANQHIGNIMEDMGYKDGDNEKRRKRLYATAQQQLVEKTRQTVKDNLDSVELPHQRVYIVSKTCLLGVLNGTVSDGIDEVVLVHDLLQDAKSRRG